jgi:AcrR family transcriptional regulator
LCILRPEVPERSRRSYHSPLREEQVRVTRDRILDALTDLLADRRSDDITTREIAERAGVSQPTVYRYFPDRAALLDGITERINLLAAEYEQGGYALDGIDEVGPRVEWLFVTSEKVPVEMRAEALLNADPRRFGDDTRRHSDELLAVVATEFPELDERQHARLAGLLRCLGSSQTWLRMREEFGVPGDEAGPLMRWAVDTLVEAVRAKGLPEIDGSAPDDEESR